MSVIVSIPVPNVNALIATGYTGIKIYRSQSISVGFSEVTNASNIIPLVGGVVTYSYTDSAGPIDSWYKSVFTDSNLVLADLAPSTDSYKGVYVDSSFPSPSYPPSSNFTNLEYQVIEKVRVLIGDKKIIHKVNIGPNVGYCDLSTDGLTFTMEFSPSWPLQVTVNGLAMTTLVDPFVIGEEYLQFSTPINTLTDTLDLWYQSYRQSDTSIVAVYNSLTPPTPLTGSEVTPYLACLCAAIEILQGEYRDFGISSGIEVDIHEEIKTNPKGGLIARAADLKALNKQKQDLIDAIVKKNLQSSICGVLID